MDRSKKKISLRIESLDLEFGIFLDYVEKIKTKVENLITSHRKNLSLRVVSDDRICKEIDKQINALETLNTYLSSNPFVSESDTCSQDGQSDINSSNLSISQENNGVRSITSSSSSLSHKVSSPFPKEIKSGVFYDAKVTYAVNPQVFFLSLLSWDPIYSEMLQKLRVYCSQEHGSLSTSNYSVGQICGVLYHDKNWHRCRIISNVSENNVKVRYLDYGNEESSEVKNLVPLPAEITDIPGFSIECSLKNVSPSGVTWNASEIQLFYDMTVEEHFKVKFQTPLNTSPFTVDLFIIDPNTGSIKNRLAKLFSTEVKKLPISEAKGSLCGSQTLSTTDEQDVLSNSKPHSCSSPAVSEYSSGPPASEASCMSIKSDSSHSLSVPEKPKSCKPSNCPSPSQSCNNLVCTSLPEYPINRIEGTVYTVRISHVYSHDDFYVHIIDSLAAKIDDITLHMEAQFGNGKSEPMVDASLVKPNTYWSVIYSDNLYYRGQVKSIKNVDGEVLYEVFYVDFGNTQDVKLSAFRLLPRTCRIIPPLAIPCKLGEIMPISHEKCKTKFLSMVKFDTDIVMVLLESHGQNRIPVILIEQDAGDQKIVFLNSLLVDGVSAKSELFGVIISNDGKILKDDPWETPGPAPPGFEGVNMSYTSSKNPREEVNIPSVRNRRQADLGSNMYYRPPLLPSYPYQFNPLPNVYGPPSVIGQPLYNQYFQPNIPLVYNRHSSFNPGLPIYYANVNNNSVLNPYRFSPASPSLLPSPQLHSLRETSAHISGNSPCNKNFTLRNSDGRSPAKNEEILSGCESISSMRETFSSFESSETKELSRECSVKAGPPSAKLQAVTVASSKSSSTTEDALTSDFSVVTCHSSYEYENAGKESNCCCLPSDHSEEVLDGRKSEPGANSKGASLAVGAVCTITKGENAARTLSEVDQKDILLRRNNNNNSAFFEGVADADYVKGKVCEIASDIEDACHILEQMEDSSQILPQSDMSGFDKGQFFFNGRSSFVKAHKDLLRLSSGSINEFSEESGYELSHLVSQNNVTRVLPFDVSSQCAHELLESPEDSVSHLNDLSNANEANFVSSRVSEELSMGYCDSKNRLRCHPTVQSSSFNKQLSTISSPANKVETVGPYTSRQFDKVLPIYDINLNLYHRQITTCDNSIQSSEGVLGFAGNLPQFVLPASLDPLQDLSTISTLEFDQHTDDSARATRLSLVEKVVSESKYLDPLVTCFDMVAEAYCGSISDIVTLDVREKLHDRIVPQSNMARILVETDSNMTPVQGRPLDPNSHVFVPNSGGQFFVETSDIHVPLGLEKDMTPLSVAEDCVSLGDYSHGAYGQSNKSNPDCGFFVPNSDTQNYMLIASDAGNDKDVTLKLSEALSKQVGSLSISEAGENVGKTDYLAYNQKLNPTCDVFAPTRGTLYPVLTLDNCESKDGGFKLEVYEEIAHFPDGSEELEHKEVDRKPDNGQGKILNPDCRVFVPNYELRYSEITKDECETENPVLTLDVCEVLSKEVMDMTTSVVETIAETDLHVTPGQVQRLNPDCSVFIPSYEAMRSDTIVEDCATNDEYLVSEHCEHSRHEILSEEVVKMTGPRDENVEETDST